MFSISFYYYILAEIFPFFNVAIVSGFLFDFSQPLAFLQLQNYMFWSIPPNIFRKKIDDNCK